MVAVQEALLSIKPSSEGGIFFSGVDFYNAVVGKVNSSGDIVWSKALGNYGYMNGMDIVEYNNHVYVTGTNYTIGYSGGHIVKLNKFTGDTTWCKIYGKTNAGYLVQFSGISIQNNQLVVNGVSNINNPPGVNNHTIFNIDTAGNFINAVEYIIPGQNIVYGLFQYPPYNSTVKVGFQTPSIDSNDFYFFKISQNQLSGFTTIVPGRQKVEVVNNCADSGFVAAITNLSYSSGLSSYQEKALLIKNDKDGNDLNCNYLSVDYSTRNVSIAVEQFIMGGNDHGDPGSSIITEIQSPQLSIEKLCITENVCRLENFNGPDSVCANQTYNYSIDTTGNCGNIIFSIDPVFASIVAITPTSVSVQFHEMGIAKLYVKMQTDCRLIMDSLYINILPSSSMMDIGPDSSICPNNQIILNAGNGYANYLWQNGSADSIFTVTNPGIYWVQATDACNNIFRDTIVINQAPAIPFDIGTDLVKCNSDSLNISAPSGFISYSWSPDYNINSSTGQSVLIFPSVDTMYKVTAEKTPGCFAYDSIYVNVNNSPLVYLGADTSFCSGNSIALNAGNDFTNYLWSNGQSGASITVNTAGIYSVIATDLNNCLSKDTLKVIDVFNNPVINLAKDSLLCKGSFKNLDAGAGMISYLWNTGATTNNISINDIGTFWVNVIDNNGCKGTDTTRITRLLALPTAYLPADTVLCSYSTLKISPTQTYLSYVWSTGSSQSTITVTQPGTYWLRVTDNFNCTGRDTIIVNPKQCLEGFFIPNAFTPNKDGKNDIFRPLLFGVVSQLKFTIYNRWGQLIYQTTELGKGWDGKVSGRDTDTDLFVWTCEYQFEGHDKKFAKGTVVLIR